MMLQSLFLFLLSLLLLNTSFTTVIIECQAAAFVTTTRSVLPTTTTTTTTTKSIQRRRRIFTTTTTTTTTKTHHQTATIPKTTTSSSSSTQLSMTHQLNQAQQVISKGISIGAPAYNIGNVKECVAIYVSTAQQIIQMIDNDDNNTTATNTNNKLPLELQTNLKMALETVTKNNNNNNKRDDDNLDDDNKAWTLRSVFDDILQYSPCYMPQCIDCLEEEDIQLEPFLSTQLPVQPVIVNDVVMGGVSTCQWIPDTSTMIGTTSLTNNGGFASLRWRFRIIQNWTYAKGIYMKCNHSNDNNNNKDPHHTFRFLIKDLTNCEMIRGANYKVTFANPGGANVGDPILIPFSSFYTLEQMGRCLGTIPIDTSTITEIGIMAIKPSIVGDFQLTIKEWGLYS